ncbi:MAG: type II toxin-antitoxin system VapC family toxin [Thermoanaerobaculia bacterium]|nr:type II toxin-antitoxin system VapC family toxin [Thermoanaerobaculia bacterium]
MRPTVYIETSIVSYLAARPSRDLITAAHQQITHTWWHDRREEFDLLASQVVLEEAAAGDARVAQKRLELLAGMPLLGITPAVAGLAAALTANLALPSRAAADALHIAVTAYHGVNFLLTWNCRHIANAAFRPKVEAVCKDQGCLVPVLCTPEELLGGESNV